MIRVLVFIVLLNYGLGLKNTEEQFVIKFLKQYGYLSEDIQHAIPLNNNTLFEAVVQFQNMAGMNMTGKIGKMELNLMKSSRCGVKDTDLHNVEPAMFSISSRKWNYAELSYNIVRYPKGIPKTDVDRIIQSAFDIWSKYTNLRFTLKRSSITDLKISWTPKEHNDNDDFDGPGNVLAHAYDPPSGLIHFDDEENWSTTPGEGKINIYHVAAHEIGHALGLGHSDNQDALMYPYANYSASFENNLHEDDIEGIKFIYERNSEQEISGDLIGSPLCTKGPIDSMMKWLGGVYIFKNKYYIRLSEDLSTVTVGNISSMWNGITDHIKVVYNGKKLYVFRYKQYWRFTGAELDEGYPRNIIEGFPGIPNYINSVIYFRTKFIFFKGNAYWVYDPRKIPVVSPIYPKYISAVLKDFPSYIDAMYYYKNSKTIYGFKGESVYLYDVRNNSTSAPISIIKDFFGC